MKFFRLILVKLGVISKPIYTSRFYITHPSDKAIKNGEIAVVRDGKLLKWCRFRCPCGCEEIILLSLGQSRSPRWQVNIDWLERPTLSPSVRRLDGCKSHFWVKGGKIDWCSDYSN